MNHMYVKRHAQKSKLSVVISILAFTASTLPMRGQAVPFASYSSPFIRTQQSEVSGYIKAADGSPISGVSIRQLSSNLISSSDEQGFFKIAAVDGDKLSFSYIGYKPLVQVVKGSSLQIVLTADESSLEEVVVTAIGIKQQKRKLGYATQEVKKEALQEAKTMNIGNALAGQVAGLTVNNPTGIFQKPNFQLRGKEPLIVINGIPVESDLFDIPSENIDNINVLKGTAASALFGSRGKNGAILITTKGAKEEGLKVNFSTSNMVTAGFTVYPKTQNEYGSGSNGQYEFWDGADGGISDGDMTWGPKLNTGLKIPQWNSPIRDKQTGEVTPWWGDVSGTKYDDKSRYERVPTDWVYHNNLKDFLSTGFVNENNLSIAYKGEKAAVFMSGKYAYQKGQVPNSSLQTGGLNLNTSYQFTSDLKLDVNLSYAKVYSPNYPRYGYGPKNHMYTILVWMGDDVNGQDLKNHLYIPGQEGYRQANYNYAWYNNPYFSAMELNQQHDRDVLQGLASLQWVISPKFNLQGRTSVRQNSLFEDMQSPKSYMNYGDSRNGDYKLFNTNQLNFDADFLANYQEQWSDNFGLNINVGTSTFRRNIRESSQSSDGLIVPFIYSLNNTQGPVQAKNFYSTKAIRSVYASLNLDIFRSTYLNFSARNDWSSTLPTQNNSYFYPSVSLSSILSDYFTMPSGWDYLKVYSSWANVSSDLKPYSIRSIYEKDVTYGSVPSVNYPKNMINPLILPEKSTSLEIGMATSFFKNRLSADITYYHVLDENQILDLKVSEASGFESRKVNGNKYRTRGLEIMLNASAIRQDNLSWDIGLNWSKQVKKYAEIFDGMEKYENFSKGDRADDIYATVWQKSAAGELILNENGMPIKDPYLKKIGYMDPDWRFGLQNKFKIHAFTIHADIDGSIGGLLNSVTHEKMWWGGKHPNSTLYRDAEYESGAYVYVPDGVKVTGGELVRDVQGQVISDTRTYEKNTDAVSWQSWSQVYPYQARVTDQEDKYFANTFDRSFVKLRRLSVGYDLNRFIQSKKFKSLDASLFGYNLWMWKNIPYVDPDYGNDTDLQDPSSRYIGLSLQLKF